VEKNVLSLNPFNFIEQGRKKILFQIKLGRQSNLNGK
jgi:hypothetical protein